MIGSTDVDSRRDSLRQTRCTFFDSFSDEVRNQRSIKPSDARRESFYGAAEVLNKLAQSDYDSPLRKRLEFLRRENDLCGSYGPMGTRQNTIELCHTLWEGLDVAVIQDDILRRVKEDSRISSPMGEGLVKELGPSFLSLSDVGFDQVSCFCSN